MKAFAIFLCCFCVSVASATNEADIALERAKRVSVEGVPSSDVNFDDGTAGGARSREGEKKPMRFRAAAPGGNGKSFPFPVLLPPYNYSSGPTLDQANIAKGCLLYMEFLTVIVWNSKSKDPKAATAKFDSGNMTNTFQFQDSYAQCIEVSKKKPDAKDQKETQFQFTIFLDKPSKPIESTKDGKTLFTVDSEIRLVLTFNLTSFYGWQLADVEAQALSVKKGSSGWLTEDLTVESGATAIESARFVKMNGMYDYSYACSSTPAAAWKVGANKEDSQYMLGVSFGNIQVQAWNALLPDKDNKDKVAHVAFSRNVNDCVGTFSPGSWMGIIVAIVLASVLMFGYLMLNSVQTMDRFDDPKQKQLIINAKE